MPNAKLGSMFMQDSLLVAPHPKGALLRIGAGLFGKGGGDGALLFRVQLRLKAIPYRVHISVRPVCFLLTLNNPTHCTWAMRTRLPYVFGKGERMVRRPTN